MTAKTEFAFRSPTDVLLTKVNPRKENHGDQHVQAVDLCMSVDVPNTKLQEMAPGLLEALFYNAAAEAGQELLEGVDAMRPNLRFPKLNDGKFGLMRKKDLFAGYTLCVEYGLGDDLSNMEFDCCKVKSLAAVLKEGGTVTLSWTCQYSGDRLDQETVGKIVMLEKDIITIELIPPVIEQIEEEKTLTAEDVFGPGASDREPDLTAEDIFTSTVEPDDTALADSDSDAR